MTDIEARLDRLGDALQAAARADLAPPPVLAAAGERRAARRPRRSARAKLAIVLGVLVLAVPAAALATGVLSPDEQVARGLPGGTAILAGTEPTCTALREGVEYDCALAHAPPETGPPPGLERAIGEFIGAPGEWQGYVAVTVDDTKHVDGGCRSENVDGTRWRCYLGEAAVRHKIVAQRFLGDYLPGPLQE